MSHREAADGMITRRGRRGTAARPPQWLPSGSDDWGLGNKHPPREGRAPEGGPELRRILIVAPGNKSRSNIRRFTDGGGLEYVICNSPADTLDFSAAGDCEPDMVVLGVEYGSMGGPQLAFLLRRRYPDTTIVMFADGHGKWETADIYACGVDLIIRRSAKDSIFDRGARAVVREIARRLPRAVSMTA